MASTVNEEKKRRFEPQSTFLSLLEILPLPALIYQKGKIKYANRRMEEATGYSRGELYSMDPWLLLSPEQRGAAKKAVQAREKGEEAPSRYEIRIVTKGGKERFWEYLGERIIFEGKPAILGMGIDITEQKLLQQALHKSEAKYRALFEATTDAVFLEGLNGTILDCNKAACRLYGYEKAEMKKLNVRDLIPPEVEKMLPEVLEELTGGTYLGESYNVKRDGTVFPVEVSSRVVEIAGEPMVATFVRDISRRKGVEEELLARNRELEYFANMISHDLRGPLSTIFGFAQTALEEVEETGASGGTIMECLRSILSVAEKTDRLIDTLLQYAVAGLRSGKKKEVDAGKILAQAADMLARRVEEAGAELVLNPPYPRVLVDPFHLHQVFHNLLENSLKHSPAGRNPVVEVGWEEGEEITFFIKDNGEGIPGENLESIFRPFVRFPDSPGEGHGLGLAIAKRAVESWGGRIWVESRPGEGSTFFFTAPPA